jgi:hypothetical protein
MMLRLIGAAFFPQAYFQMPAHRGLADACRAVDKHQRRSGRFSDGARKRGIDLFQAWVRHHVLTKV